jgi:hypothetical protein
MKTESGTAEATDSLCAHTLLSPKRLPEAPRSPQNPLKFLRHSAFRKIQHQPRLSQASPPSSNLDSPLSHNCVSHQPPSHRARRAKNLHLAEYST